MASSWSVTLITLWLPTGISCFMYPRNWNSSTGLAPLTLMEYAPLASVLVPVAVPLSTTVAPSIGVTPSGSNTVPVTCLS